MDTLKANEKFTFFPSTIGAKGFHYPNLENPEWAICGQDTQIKFLPFVCLQDRSLTAYQVPPGFAQHFKLPFPVIWIRS